MDPLIIFLGYNRDILYGISLKEYLFDRNVTAGHKFIDSYIANYFELDSSGFFTRKESYKTPAALLSFWKSIVEGAGAKQNRTTKTISSYVRQYSIKEFKIKNIKKVINIDQIKEEMKRARVYRKDGTSIEEYLEE